MEQDPFARWLEILRRVAAVAREREARHNADETVQGWLEEAAMGFGEWSEIHRPDRFN